MCYIDGIAKWRLCCIRPCLSYSWIHFCPCCHYLFYSNLSRREYDFEGDLDHPWIMSYFHFCFGLYLQEYLLAEDLLSKAIHFLIQAFLLSSQPWFSFVFDSIEVSNLFQKSFGSSLDHPFLALYHLLSRLDYILEKIIFWYRLLNPLDIYSYFLPCLCLSSD